MADAVWISYAQFEMSIEGEERLQRCRQVYEEANRSLRMCEEKEERLMLLEAWRNFEQEFGTSANKDRVRKLLPEKVKKRKKLTAEDGSDAGWEEYYDYIFPEDAANQPNLKLLAMAKMWKKQQQQDEPQEEQEREKDQSAEPTQQRDEREDAEETREAEESDCDDRDDDSSSSESDSDEENPGHKPEEKTSPAEED